MVDDLTLQLLKSNQFKRKPKAGRKFAHRNKIEVKFYIDFDLLVQLNEAWLMTEEQFFSRWICKKLKEAVK